jgi:hypothetical protein
MTYAQTSDLLIFEGDGRTDAELYRQEHAGSEASSIIAQKILYWHKDNRAKVEGLRSMNMNQYPNGEMKKGTKVPGMR